MNKVLNLNYLQSSFYFTQESNETLFYDSKFFVISHFSYIFILGIREPACLNHWLFRLNRTCGQMWWNMENYFCTWKAADGNTVLVNHLKEYLFFIRYIFIQNIANVKQNKAELQYDKTWDYTIHKLKILSRLSQQRLIILP